VHRLRRILGVKPTTLAEGLRTTYQWYTKQKTKKADVAFEDSLLAQLQAVAPPAPAKRTRTKAV